MTYVKWSVIVLLIGVVVAFLHHYLPSQDVVRVVRTETVRVDVETTDAQGNPAQTTRDQNRIYTFTPDGDERVYRNEDTGWGFPWYFKFDTANLAAAAEDAVSTKAAPQWYVMRHYGWRIPMLSMFPNALTIREADGPDEQLIPWFNIVFLIVMALLVLMVRRILITLRERHVDPVIDDIDREIDESAGWLRRQWRRLFG
jgi:quinol-cytochrome oxidoreductase complex cytochrome b subunit